MMMMMIIIIVIIIIMRTDTVCYVFIFAVNFPYLWSKI